LICLWQPLIWSMRLIYHLWKIDVDVCICICIGWDNLIVNICLRPWGYRQTGICICIKVWTLMQWMNFVGKRKQLYLVLQICRNVILY
jgi:hypothetical protein